STVLGDATVQATQALTGGPTIDVGAQNVDDLLGSYRFHLPVAAPVKAPFVSAATPLVFTADTAVAAKYSLRASTPGKTPQDKPLTLVTGTNASINFSFTP
ncbi:MAG TPA: hypothetical protein VLJ58_01910, partial [Ramlibacter sp.]|nr:hypothetical protein [Ramlibacter sp.]